MNQKALNQFSELTYTEQVSVVGGDLSVEVIMKGIFTGIFDAGYQVGQSIAKWVK
ncbi:hypothetical protein [Lacticaseibacillus paracasei]|uniref:hypothetical protein n=1 Tax=Lacticaseibacillus paracasei TaxID=1597 RepID=UPI000297A8D6|nr:hypothetical protein LCA32G_0040 [Lacticaseibacillus paracasei]